MYQAFKAIVANGKIRPLERIKLKESTPLLVTIVDPNESPKREWSRLQKWIQKQKRNKKFTSYASIEEASKHLKRLFRQ